MFPVFLSDHPVPPLPVRFPYIPNSRKRRRTMRTFSCIVRAPSLNVHGRSFSPGPLPKRFPPGFSVSRYIIGKKKNPQKKTKKKLHSLEHSLPLPHEREIERDRERIFSNECGRYLFVRFLCCRVSMLKNRCLWDSDPTKPQNRDICKRSTGMWGFDSRCVHHVLARVTLNE
jgi:hypothetical protein